MLVIGAIWVGGGHRHDLRPALELEAVPVVVSIGIGLLYVDVVGSPPWRGTPTSPEPVHAVPPEEPPPDPAPAGGNGNLWAKGRRHCSRSGSAPMRAASRRQRGLRAWHTPRATRASRGTAARSSSWPTAWVATPQARWPVGSAVETLVEHWTARLPSTSRAQRCAARSARRTWRSSTPRRRRGRGGHGHHAHCAHVNGTEAFIAHVGDTRAYLVRGETCTQLTTDHSRVGEMLRMKLVTVEQAAVHPGPVPADEEPRRRSPRAGAAGAPTGEER